jgi:23S rRNA pseudouridine1911/1915/1917 synthase
MNKNSIDILYQDDDIVVINKPAGVVVNQAKSVSGPTIQDWMAEEVLAQQSTSEEWQPLVPTSFSADYGSPEDIFADRRGMVHRLDKDTSGVLVLAKNPGSLVNLLAQFRQRQVSKKYRCLTHGKFSITDDTVNLPLARSKIDRQKFTTDPEGRVAETVYQVQQFYPHLDVEQVVKLQKQQPPDSSAGKNFGKRAEIYQGFSLVDCWPKTGRTHQIRVHMAALKHPLVGDIKYVGRKRATLDPIWCQRQFLHALEVEFTHPRTKKTMVVTAPLASDLVEVLSLLKESA